MYFSAGRSRRSHLLFPTRHLVGLDSRSVRNNFTEYLDQLDATRCIETPGILGIDELHVLGAPRAIFTNLEANTIIELLDNRRKASVIQYLRQLRQPERIRTVVSDLWQPYREAVQIVLPDATLGADNFHMLKFATSALYKLPKEIRAGLTDTQ